MPWQKRYDEAEVIDRAMNLFWVRGYEATSMSDLVAATGINRGSIYSAFTDKRTLYIRALKRYDEFHRQKFLTKLRKENPPRETILAMFEAARVWPLTEGHPPGCFLINAAFEFADRDPEICEMVYESSVRIELFFKKLILESQGEGTVPLHIDAGETARGLLSLLIGLRVLSHSKPQSPMLKSILKQAELMIS